MPRYGGKYGQGYVIMAGMRGYMPDFRSWASTKKEAIEAVREEIEQAAYSAMEWDTEHGLSPEEMDKAEKEAKAAAVDGFVNLEAIANDLGAYTNFWGWEYIEWTDSDLGPEEYGFED